MLKIKKQRKQRSYSDFNLNGLVSEYRKVVKGWNKKHGVRTEKHILYRKRPHDLVKKYIEFKLESLILYGNCFFGEKILAIKRKTSDKGIEWDKKWNGYDYYGEYDGKVYTFSVDVMEKIYNKVKDNWLVYG